MIRHRYSIFPIIICSIFLVLSFCFLQKEDKYLYCGILISLYLLLYIGVIQIYKYLNHITSFFVFFLTFVRYFLIPLLICIDNDYMSYAPLDSANNARFFYNGIYFTMWEALFFGIFINRAFRKWYHKNQVYNCYYLNLQKGNNSVLYFEIAILIMLVFITPSVIENYSLMFNLKSSGDLLVEEEEVTSSLSETISVMGVRCLKILLPIPISSYYYHKYKLKPKTRYFFISAASLIFMYALIMEGNSRNTIIIPAISLIFILISLFPHYKKKIWTTMIIIIVVISVTSIIFKVFSNNVSNMVKASSFSYWIMYLEVYFAGITNMGKVVAAKALYSYPFNPLIMWNDATQNMPILSNLSNLNNTSEYYYFKVWNRNDQIIPSSGNGIFYFGYFLGPIIPILITKLAYKFESISNHVKTVPEFIIFTFACATVSYNIFNSVSSLFMKLFITILPVVIIVSINKRIK